MSTLNDPLAAYYAEIYAVEDGWYADQTRNQCIPFDSLWPSHLPLLFQIDARYGVRECDPRVYSIVAYQQEALALQEAHIRDCRAKGYDRPVLSEAESRQWLSDDLRHGKRQADCAARHFPGLNLNRPATADTIPKLWRLVTWCADFHHTASRVDGPNRPSSEEKATRKPAASFVQLEEVYCQLLNCNIAWAQGPPFPNFTPGEAVAALGEMARNLARDDANGGHPPATPHIPADAKGDLSDCDRPALLPSSPAASLEQTDPTTRAIALMLTWVRQRRKYTVNELAAAARVDRSTLYRDPLFKEARKVAKALWTAPPKGSKDDEGNLEACDPEDDD